MKTLPFILSLALVGCSHSGAPGATAPGVIMGEELHQWIPANTSLAAARQIMEQHQYACSVASYDSLNGITNNPDAVQWTKEFIRNHGSEAVTNISVLDCDVPNERHAQWLLVNGKTYQLLQWGVTAKT
jgi:hypothetical protein